MPWTRYFALRVLTVHEPAPAPVVGQLLLRVDTSWTGRACMQFLREFIAARVAGGEVLTFGAGLATMPEVHGQFLQEFLEHLGPELAAPLAAEISEWQRTRVNVTFLASIFRSVRFGAADAHGRANLMQLSFLEEKGAFLYDPETKTYRVDLEKMGPAVSELASVFLKFQGDGDYEGLGRFQEKYQVVSPRLQESLRSREWSLLTSWRCSCSWWPPSSNGARCARCRIEARLA